MYRRASKRRETHRERNARNVLMLGIQTTHVPSDILNTAAPPVKATTQKFCLSLPSDAQLLHWTLVDDGVLPDGYCAYFADLMGSVESAAARQARATFVDNPSADLFVHQFHKDMSQVRSQEKTVADQFAQAFTHRLSRFLHENTGRAINARSSRDQLRGRTQKKWNARGGSTSSQSCSLILSTPIGHILKANPMDCQYLGAGRRASTLHALVRYSKNFLQWLISARSKSVAKSHAIEVLFATLADASNFLRRSRVLWMRKSCRKQEFISSWQKRY